MKSLIVIESIYSDYSRYASSSHYTEIIHNIVSRNALPSDAYYLGIL